MIFVVDATTFGDMDQHKVFGLPLSYLKEMVNLREGKTALFLLDRHSKVLTGLFTPVGKAGKNVVPNIWTDRNGICKFPAQVKYRKIRDLTPIPKNSSIAPAFLRNMKVKGKYL